MEVENAFKSMGPTKASKDDKFSILFYHHYWHIVGHDISAFCLNILNDDMALDSINSTQFVLIPEVPHPMDITNFRPISLCTILYKLVAKTIASRLQWVLNRCINAA